MLLVLPLNSLGNRIAGDNKTIVDLILQARTSTDSKKKQISLQWSIVLFGWTSLTVDTAIILSGKRLVYVIHHHISN